MLPRLRREADSEWLAGPLDEHLEETTRHVGRVEQVFLELGAEPTAAASEALEGLRREHDGLVARLVEPRLRDIFLAGAAARSEHLEIALYRSLVLLAHEVGVDSEPLEENLRDEEQALDRLEDAAAKLREKLPT